MLHENFEHNLPLMYKGITYDSASTDKEIQDKAIMLLKALTLAKQSFEQTTDWMWKVLRHSIKKLHCRRGSTLQELLMWKVYRLIDLHYNPPSLSYCFPRIEFPTRVLMCNWHVELICNPSGSRGQHLGIKFDFHRQKVGRAGTPIDTILCKAPDKAVPGGAVRLLMYCLAVIQVLLITSVTATPWWVITGQVT
ncbi:hypothetical protein J6590_019483 [Homalodisca vitripennis]|nr:hypothetical protein J6590_019483 [Homalodisca vitripennis]